MWGFLVRPRRPLLGARVLVALMVGLAVVGLVVWRAGTNSRSALSRVRAAMASIDLPAGAHADPARVTSQQTCGDADSVAYSSVERVIRFDEGGPDPLVRVAEAVRDDGWTERPGPEPAEPGSRWFGKEIDGRDLSLSIVPTIGDARSVRATVDGFVLC